MGLLGHQRRGARGRASLSYSGQARRHPILFLAFSCLCFVNSIPPTLSRANDSEAVRCDKESGWISCCLPAPAFVLAGHLAQGRANHEPSGWELCQVLADDDTSAPMSHRDYWSVWSGLQHGAHTCAASSSFAMRTPFALCLGAVAIAGVSRQQPLKPLSELLCGAWLGNQIWFLKNVLSSKAAC